MLSIFHLINFTYCLLIMHHILKCKYVKFIHSLCHRLINLTLSFKVKLYYKLYNF